MSRTLFLAGATGVLGQAVLPLLLAEGYTVVGTTRSPQKAEALRGAGVQPVLCDVYDRAALLHHVVTAAPHAILHLLTDLPPALDPARMPDALVSNARIREEGTRNLVAAAAAAGVSRFLAESIAFAYVPAPRPLAEDTPLNTSAEGGAGVTARGVQSLEQQVLAGPFAGIVLRFGALYGPGTGFDQPGPVSPLHVDDAAEALRLALTRGGPGIYNIAEDDGALDLTRAATHLGWHARHRSATGTLPA